MERIKVSQAIVVEGRYDKAKLSSLVDGIILTTEGFRIFKSKEKLALIKEYARTIGVILMTDPDSAGFIIRSYLKDAIKDGKVWQVYMPDILGKERRKEAPSKEGKLGVEGLEAGILLEALERSGALKGEVFGSKGSLKPADLYELGLSGGSDSSKKRAMLLKTLRLPERLSAKGLIEFLNTRYTSEEAVELIKSMGEPGAGGWERDKV